MIKSTKQPSQLLQDNDGHWYLVPGTHLAQFEAALALEDVQSTAMGKFTRFAIDGPHRLIILDWREL
jgi:hypothetical protein